MFDRASLRLPLAALALSGVAWLAATGCGSCSPPPPPPAVTCGDGVLDPDEDCDFGTSNGAGTGCESTCKFSCADTCEQSDPCRASECLPVVVSGTTGHRCQPGRQRADGTPCEASSICLAAVCRASSCGDGFVDPAAAEQCEPPGSGLCSPTCKGLDAGCGNGVRESGEQCDDGNGGSLDGCAACRFEQTQRLSRLKVQFTRTAACPANVFGEAFGMAVQGQVQTSLDDGVRSGALSVLLAYDRLEDLSGAADPEVQLGVVSGGPVFGPFYDGTNALDWWYVAEPESLDLSHAPKETLAAAFDGGVMTAGPGRLSMRVSLGAAPATLRLSNVKLSLQTGAVATVTQSVDGGPPGHTRSEQLDPALTSFASAGGTSSGPSGDLCGDISAASLALAGVPPVVQAGSPTACAEAYSASNSQLDVLAGGCKVLGLSALNPVQPDQVDPAEAVLGAGPPYKLSASGANRVVDRCADKNGGAVDFTSCLRAAAFSSQFKVSTQRVILR